MSDPGMRRLRDQFIAIMAGTVFAMGWLCGSMATGVGLSSLLQVPLTFLLAGVIYLQLRRR